MANPCTEVLLLALRSGLARAFKRKQTTCWPKTWMTTQMNATHSQIAPLTASTFQRITASRIATSDIGSISISIPSYPAILISAHEFRQDRPSRLRPLRTSRPQAHHAAQPTPTHELSTEWTAVETICARIISTSHSIGDCSAHSNLVSAMQSCQSLRCSTASTTRTTLIRCRLRH